MSHKSTTDLDYADLRGANLIGANLHCADFRDAILEGAKNVDLTGVAPAQITPPVGYKLVKLS